MVDVLCFILLFSSPMVTGYGSIYWSNSLLSMGETTEKASN